MERLAPEQPSLEFQPRPEQRVVPIADLPAVDSDLVAGTQFLSRRTLRPILPGQSAGVNFHNAPILGVGMEYKDDQAILTVSSLNEYNTMVDTHNPGGLRYLAVHGSPTPSQYLRMVADKRHPRGSDPTPNLPVLNYYRFLMGYTGQREEVEELPITIQSSILEHDVVDHGGIGLLAVSEVDKIAATAEVVLQGRADLHKIQTENIDNLLTLLSYYALVSARSADRLDQTFRRTLMLHAFSVTVLMNLRLPEDAQLHLDFDALDQTIATMQSLGRGNRLLGQHAVETQIAS